MNLREKLATLVAGKARYSARAPLGESMVNRASCKISHKRPYDFDEKRDRKSVV